MILFICKIFLIPARFTLEVDLRLKKSREDGHLDFLVCAHLKEKSPIKYKKDKLVFLQFCLGGKSLGGYGVHLATKTVKNYF